MVPAGTARTGTANYWLSARLSAVFEDFLSLVAAGSRDELECRQRYCPYWQQTPEHLLFAFRLHAGKNLLNSWCRISVTAVSVT